MKPEDIPTPDDPTPRPPYPSETLDPPDPTAPTPAGLWSRMIAWLEGKLLHPKPRAWVWGILLLGLFILFVSWVVVASESGGMKPPLPSQPSRTVDLFAQDSFSGFITSAVIWLEPALQWLVAYPLFPLVILFFWLVSWGGLGRELGIPDLVWPDSFWQRLWVGIAVSLLFTNLLFVRYLVEFRSGSQVDFGSTPSLFWLGGPSPAFRDAGRFLFCTLVPALAIFYVPRLFLPYQWRAGHRNRLSMGMLIGLLAGVGATIGLAWLDTRTELSSGFLGPLLNGKLPWAPLHLRGIEEHTQELHGRATVIAAFPVLFLIVFLIVSRLGGVWSPVWSVALIIGLLSSVYGFVAFHLAGLQLVFLLGILAIAWVCNRSQPYKMSHPGMEEYLPIRGGTLVDLDEKPAGRPTPPITAAELLTAFHRNWSGAETPGENDPKPKMVLLGVSGGGIRAAVWTAVVLEGLERAIAGTGGKGAFRDHIRLITGASGGMLGAALYTADFENYPNKKPESLSDMLARDGLWPTIQTMLYRDLPAVFVPWEVDWDRGRSLEAAWEENTRAYPNNADRPDWLERAARIRRNEVPPHPSPLARTFEQLRELEAAAKRPSLLISPMMVEDCRRALFTNLDVSGLIATECDSLNPPANLAPDPAIQSMSAVDIFSYFPQSYSRLKVGTAARMNATFPFINPGVSLPSQPPRRVVDAGYFDNFGTNLAASWLLAHQDEIRKHTSGVVYIEIRAFPRRVEKVRFRPLQEEGDLLTWGLSELSTPMESLINLYSRGAYYRNDQLLEQVCRAFNRDDATKDFFTTVNFEVAGATALNWTLPVAEAARIRRGFSNWNPARPDAEENYHVGVAEQVAALKRWFGRGGD